jgi:hypothetical protein
MQVAGPFHSVLAAGIGCAGQVGIPVAGFGSLRFIGRLQLDIPKYRRQM